MTRFTGPIRTTIRVTVVTVFVLATLLTVALASGLQYYFGQALARQTASDLYATASSSIALEVANVGRVNANVIDLLAHNPVLQDTQRPQEILRVFAGVLEKNPLYYGIYLGGGDGSFYEVINLDSSPRARAVLRALPTDRWLVLEVESGAAETVRHYHYLDASMQRRFSRSEPTSFDVTARPWYAAAMQADSAVFTDPYLFAQSGDPGRTVSRRIDGTDTVVAIDITLSASSRFLREQRIAEHGDVYLYTADGDILASSRRDDAERGKLPGVAFELTAAERRLVGELGELTVSNELNWPPVDYAQTGRPSGYSVDLLRLIADMTGLRLKFVNGHSWSELVELYQEGKIDLLQSVVLTRENAAWGLPGQSYLRLPYALVTKTQDKTYSDLGAFRDRSIAIPEGWSVAATVRERFPDTTLLPARSTLHALQMVLAGEADAALDNEIVIRYTAGKHFLAGLQYHGDVNFGAGPVPDRLHIMVKPQQAQLRALLDRAIAAIGDEQHAFLRQRWLSFETDRADPLAGQVPSRDLLALAADPSRHAQLVATEVDGEPYLAYATPVGSAGRPIYMGILSSPSAVFDPVLDKVKLSSAITTAILLCLLPLSWFFANPIVRPVRQLARENDKVMRREYDAVQRVPSHVRELDELSDSMVNMVNAIKAHEMAQRRLMDS